MKCFSFHFYSIIFYFFHFFSISFDFSSISFYFLHSYPSITSGLPLQISHFAFKRPLYCRHCWMTPNAVVVMIYKPIALAFHRTNTTIINTKKTFIYFIIPLISGIPGVFIHGIFGACVGPFIKVINDICIYMRSHARAEIITFQPVRRSTPRKVVCIVVISTLRNCKKL